MKIGEIIKQTRKQQGLSQEILAEHLGVSVQAVSKWECGMSCPDITLLVPLADFLNLSLDKLLREKDAIHEGAQNEGLDLPDDNTLRIVSCIGRRIISREEWKKENTRQKISLHFDETWQDKMVGKELHLEIWGNADMDGSIIINGNVDAGGGINCGNIGNNADARGGINCGNVGNNADAGGGINCGNVGNNADAGGSINCGDVIGSVNCSGEIHCHKIMGDVIGGAVFYDK